MKKIIYGVAFTFTLLFVSNATAQAVLQNNVLVDVYYGTPTLFQRIVKTAATDSSGNSSLDINTIGPVGIRGEFMASDKFGVGIDVGYNNIKVGFKRTETITDPVSGNSINVDYNDVISTYKLGVMATFNYHFIENDDFDIAGVFGIGYGGRKFLYSTDEPGVPDSDSGFGILIPVALRVGVNMRYYFTENIGVNFNLGLGQGGLANGGISFKF